MFVPIIVPPLPDSPTGSPGWPESGVVFGLMPSPLTTARKTPAWGDPTVYPAPPSPGRIEAHEREDRARIACEIKDGTAVPMADPNPLVQYRALIEIAIEENIAIIADTNQVEYVVNDTDRTPTP